MLHYDLQNPRPAIESARITPQVKGAVLVVRLARGQDNVKSEFLKTTDSAMLYFDDHFADRHDARSTEWLEIQ